MSRVSKPIPQRTHKKKMEALQAGKSAEQIRLEKNASRKANMEARRKSRFDDARRRTPQSVYKAPSAPKVELKVPDGVPAPKAPQDAAQRKPGVFQAI